MFLADEGPSCSRGSIPKGQAGHLAFEDPDAPGWLAKSKSVNKIAM